MTKDIVNSRRTFRRFEKGFLDRAKSGGMRECRGQFSIYRIDPLLYEEDWQTKGISFMFYIQNGGFSVAGKPESEIDLTMLNEEYRGNQYLLLRLEGFRWNGANNAGCGVDHQSMTDGIYFLSSAKDDYTKDPYLSIDMQDQTSWTPGPLRLAVSEICGIDLYGHRNPFFKGVYFSKRIDAMRDIEEVIEAREIYNRVKSQVYEFLRPPVYDKDNLEAMKEQVRTEKKKLEERLNFHPK